MAPACWLVWFAQLFGLMLHMCLTRYWQFNVYISHNLGHCKINIYSLFPADGVCIDVETLELISTLIVKASESNKCQKDSLTVINRLRLISQRRVDRYTPAELIYTCIFKWDYGSFFYYTGCYVIQQVQCTSLAHCWWPIISIYVGITFPDLSAKVQ